MATYWSAQYAASYSAGGMSPQAPDALIYLIDAFGRFPTAEPMCPVVWVLSCDGADERTVPIDSVIRMPRPAR